MLLATLLLATNLACLHYAARLQRLHIHLSTAHRVAPLLHSNGRVVSGGGGGLGGNQFLRPEYKSLLSSDYKIQTNITESHKFSLFYIL